MNKRIKAILNLFFYFIFVNLHAQNPASWQSAGPSLFPYNASGQINGIGRVCQVKFHPSDPQKVYAVSASGGLWTSGDACNSWQKTGSDQLPLTACSSVCIDYTNDSILYLSSGDPNYYSTGNGLYKSVDAGSTWTLSNTGMGNRMSLELIMDPTDHLILVAATNDGIWKTIDGGQTWNQKKNGGQFTDMAIKPVSGTRTLYAVTFSEFYKSEDFGETWTLINNGIAVPGGGSGQGMRLAVSPADSNVVYTGMIRDEGTIFKSTDGGNTFTTVYHNPSQSLVGYDASGNGQGNYNFSMCADPVNANIVFVGAHVVWRSMDGGVTWSQLTQWWQGLHTDMHQMFFNPYNATELYNINDGGVWRSLNAGLSWGPKSNGIEATEIYKAASNPLRADNISIGTQDNGELYSFSGQWRTNRGGDWTSRMTYDYYNLNRVYYHENGKRRNVAGGSELSFGLPFTSTNSCRLAFSPLNADMGLAGINEVYLTYDLGNNTPSWTQISAMNASIKSMAFASHTTDIAYVLTTPNLIRKFTGINSGFFNTSQSSIPFSFNNGASIACLTSDTNVIYITAGSMVFRSNDQGASWSNATLNLPNINILKIIHDPYSSDESVYICNSAGVWYKNMNMTSWYNYSQGLPAIANITEFMFYDDGPLNSSIRVATYGRGVWQSNLQMPSSSLFENTTVPSILISPNPASQKIHLALTGYPESTIRKIQIYSNLGNLVFESVNPLLIKSRSLDISILSPGIYQIILYDPSEHKVCTGRFIKE